MEGGGFEDLEVNARVVLMESYVYCFVLDRG
jgi:hypothetical protein